MKVCEIKIQSLKGKISQLKANVCDLNQKGRSHEDLVRKVMLYRKKLALYENKAEESQVFNRKNESGLANVCVSAQPVLIKKPVAPKRFRLLMFVLAAGCTAAIAFPFLLEAVDNKIKSADDVEAFIKLPVICGFNDIR